MTKANVNFIKLNQEELSSKIALLVSEKTRIIFWKTTPRYYEGKAFHYEIRNQKTYFVVNSCNHPLQFNSETICLNFSLNGIEYFLRGKVILQEKDELKIELEDSCFRGEKRAKERLLTYPVYEVYAYFKYLKPQEQNVIYFNKKDQQNRDFFTEIENIKKSKLQALTPELELEESEEVIGFRVEDLSSSGLSFFATEKEKETILDKLTTEKFNMILNFESDVFNLDEATIVYKINYINALFSGVPMFKVGINFKSNLKLKNKIEEHAGITVDLFDYQKEFEEFIKNE